MVSQYIYIYNYAYLGIFEQINMFYLVEFWAKLLVHKWLKTHHNSDRVVVFWKGQIKWKLVSLINLWVYQLLWGSIL